MCHMSIAPTFAGFGWYLCAVVTASLALNADDGRGQVFRTGGASPASSFAIHGSNTIGARLMPAIIEAYAASVDATASTATGDRPEEVGVRLATRAGNTLATIALHSHGSGTAVPGLVKGGAAIGMMSRPIDDKEVKSALAVGLPDLRGPGHEHVLALDGLLILTSPQNPVGSLTLDQIAAIFSGKLTDWSALGRPPGAIEVYARDDKSGTFDTFNALVLKPRKLAIRADATRLESSEELSDQVASNPRAIRFVGFAYLRSAKAVSIENDCGITIQPTTFDIKTEMYPLARRLYLYTGKPSEQSTADELLKFALSSKARDAVVSAGFIDQEFELPNTHDQLQRVTQGLSALEPDVDVAALKNLATTLKTTARLSVNLFFRDQSATLDNKALEDVKRVAAYLRGLARTHPDKKVILAGFSDSRGPFKTNAALSAARAAEVRRAVLQAAGADVPASMVESRGFSELLPLNCQATKESLQRNRRVEVWVQ